MLLLSHLITVLKGDEVIVDIDIERRIDQLCDLAAREHDCTKLKNVIEQLLECIRPRQQQREAAKRILFSGGGQNENSR